MISRKYLIVALSISACMFNSSSIFALDLRASITRVYFLRHRLRELYFLRSSYTRALLLRAYQATF